MIKFFWNDRCGLYSLILQHFGLLSTSGEVKDWKEQLGILQDFIAREFRDTLDIKFTKGKKMQQFFSPY